MRSKLQPLLLGAHGLAQTATHQPDMIGAGEMFRHRYDWMKTGASLTDSDPRMNDSLIHNQRRMQWTEGPQSTGTCADAPGGGVNVAGVFFSCTELRDLFGCANSNFFDTFPQTIPLTSTTSIQLPPLTACQFRKYCPVSCK